MQGSSFERFAMATDLDVEDWPLSLSFWYLLFIHAYFCLLIAVFIISQSFLCTDKESRWLVWQAAEKTGDILVRKDVEAVGDALLRKRPIMQLGPVAAKWAAPMHNYSDLRFVVR